MWELLGKILTRQQLKSASRGTFLGLAMIGACTIPLTYIVAGAAYDELKTMKDGIGKIQTSLNDITTKLAVTAGGDGDRDRRITQIEEVNRVQGDYIARFAEHIARLEGEVGNRK